MGTVVRMTNHPIAGAGVVLGRVIQATLVLLSLVFVAGSFQMPMIAAVFVWVFVLVLLAFVGVVQVTIGGMKSQWGEHDD